jgi:hypothetical protein
VLRRFIGASEDGRKRSFVFRRDPRDISTIYFWDPEVGQYSAIPYRNTTYPPLSVWELRELRRTLAASGASPIDEAAIFAAYARLREHGYFCPSPRKVPNADFRPELLTKHAFCSKCPRRSAVERKIPRVFRPIRPSKCQK